MEPSSSPRVGLVGSGNVGRAFGRRLLAAGRPLSVFDRDRRAARPLLEAGATWADSPAELAADCSFLVSCLPRSEDVKSVALGPNGLWAHAAPRTIHLETSTVGPACIGELCGRAAAARIRLIDGPVSRGALSDDARDVELVLWIGAAADHYDLARPTLDLLADRVVYCGGVGLGQTTKIVNNLIAHVLIVLVGEALALGVRAGATLDLLSTALQYGTAQNRMLDELFPSSVFQGDFRPGLRLDLALKDLELARQLAAEANVGLILSRPVRDLFEQARARGWGDLSAHAIVRLIEERNGVRLRSLLDGGGS